MAFNADGTQAAAIEVNSESDFVSKNPEFIEFVEKLAAIALAADKVDENSILEMPYGSEGTVKDVLTNKIATIGENMNIRRVVKCATPGMKYVGYSHQGGRIGVIIGLETEASVEDVTVVGKDVAMQIAALNPRFWDKSDVTPDVLEAEKKVMLAQMDNDPKMASKPQQVKEKIVEGKLNKFYSENCLLQQDFVKDGEFTVEKYIASAAKALGGAVKFNDAIRFEKGEGIEKRQDDLAAEVAKMIQ